KHGPSNSIQDESKRLERKDSMLRFSTRRRWAAAAMLLAGLAAGCRSTHDHSCSNCAAGHAVASAPASQPAAIATAHPPASNERIVIPSRPQSSPVTLPPTASAAPEISYK